MEINFGHASGLVRVLTSVVGIANLNAFEIYEEFETSKQKSVLIFSFLQCSLISDTVHSDDKLLMQNTDFTSGTLGPGAQNLELLKIPVPIVLGALVSPLILFV